MIVLRETLTKRVDGLFTMATQDTQGKQVQRASAPFPLPEMLSRTLEFFKALASNLKVSDNTYTGKIWPSSKFYSILKTGNWTTLNTKTSNSQSGYCCTPSICQYPKLLGTALALLRLLSFLPAVANKTHLEHGQDIHFGGFRAQGLYMLSHKDMDFHGHEKGAKCATCTFAAEL